MTLKEIEGVAKVAYAVNRAFCQSYGEEVEPWDAAPDWKKARVIGGVIQYRLNADLTSEQTHDHWVGCMEKDGWVYGYFKDEEKKTHPCIVPFDELSRRERIKDHLFLAVVRALCDGIA